MIRGWKHENLFGQSLHSQDPWILLFFGTTGSLTEKVGRRGNRVDTLCPPTEGWSNYRTSNRLGVYKLPIHKPVFSPPSMLSPIEGGLPSDVPEYIYYALITNWTRPSTSSLIYWSSCGCNPLGFLRIPHLLLSGPSVAQAVDKRKETGP